MPPATKVSKPKATGGRRGGARVGAGRPATARAVKKTAANVIFARREAGGKEPLAIMLEAMDEVNANEGPVAAFQLAQACAVYMHPKMSSIEVAGPGGAPIEQRVTVVDENQIKAAVKELESEY